MPPLSYISLDCAESALYTYHCPQCAIVPPELAVEVVAAMLVVLVESVVPGVDVVGTELGGIELGDTELLTEVVVVPAQGEEIQNQARSTVSWIGTV